MHKLCCQTGASGVLLRHFSTMKFICGTCKPDDLMQEVSSLKMPTQPRAANSTSQPRLTLTADKLVWVLSLTLGLLQMSNVVESRYMRCFVCRSRGTLGDCRDPFSVNATSFDGQTSANNSNIEATACASGWCSKTIEDDFSDAIVATERSCMTRPPTDNEERCADTYYENQRDRKVHLCMCYGDLCNEAADRNLSSHTVLAVALAATIYLLMHSAANSSTLSRRSA